MNKKLKLEALNRLSVSDFKNTPKIPLQIVLDDVRSHHNVGAIFRTADAFAIEKILCCGITPTPPHREIHKTALGAEESITWEYLKEVRPYLQQLKALNYTIFSLEQTEKSTDIMQLSTIDFDKAVLIVGNEVNGVHQNIIDFSDFVLEIPQFGTKHSLNVGISAGISLWEFNKKLRK